MDMMDMDMVDMDMVNQRNITQGNLSHSRIPWTTGHGHSGPRKQSIAMVHSPQFGNTMFVRKTLWFILHFRALGTFLVFTKMVTFWVVLWLEEVGMDDAPPCGENSCFFLFFYRMNTF